MPNGNPAPGPLNSRYFRPVRGKETRARRWDLQFESTSLQRRVCKPSVPREIRVAPEQVASPGSKLGLAVRSPVMHSAGVARSPC